MLNRGLDKLELLRIVDAVANEKSIDKDIVIGSMESAIQKAALTKFGQNNNILVKIPVIKNILLNEYGFNQLSNSLIPTNIKKISEFLWKKTDISLIDNTFVNGSANIVSSISNKIRLLQTGYIYHYAFIMIIGLLFFLIIFYDF